MGQLLSHSCSLELAGGRRLNPTCCVLRCVPCVCDLVVAAQASYAIVSAARPDGGLAPETVETAPVWVSSAPIEIPANHWIRIQGYCKIDEAIQGSLEGFLIRDSLGGDALAPILRRTDGWQPFVIYRATNEPHTLQLQFALTGYGTVYLDEVTVQMASNNPTMGGTNENQRLGEAGSDKPTTIDR